MKRKTARSGIVQMINLKGQFFPKTDFRDTALMPHRVFLCALRPHISIGRDMKALEQDVTLLIRHFLSAEMKKAKSVF